MSSTGWTAPVFFIAVVKSGIANWRSGPFCACTADAAFW